MSAALDPDVAALLLELNARVPVALDAGPDELRAGFAELLTLLHPEEQVEFDGTVTDGLLPSSSGGVPIRTYDPAAATGADAVVFLHGGGWVLGSLDSAHPVASAIAAQMGLRVVSVGYRLAPEHPHPAAFDDCLAVLRAVSSDGTRWMGVAGDSAGGHLAASVAIAAADAGIAVDGQLLFYPALDPTMSAPSQETFAEGHLLTRAAMRYYWDAYRGAASTAEVSLSPWNATDLAAMPPTVITVAGHDPLHDEGVEFARRLLSDGVPTTFLPAPALIHGWVDQIDRIPAARRALADAVGAFDVIRARHNRRD